MKTEKLFQLLTLVKGIRSVEWNRVLQLIDIIKKGSVTIKEKRWEDKWKQESPEYYPLDLSDIKNWSTYNNTCIDLYFSNDTTLNNEQSNNQLVCKVKIYDGESFNGYRRNLRFEALLWLPTEFLHTIERSIEFAFESYLENAYENYLEEQRKLWINNMKNKILNN